MKRKLVAILTLCMVLCLSFGAFACAGTPNDKDHEHNFNGRRIDSEYLASKATCTEKAKYYYSCDCGEKDTETFDHGTVLDHDYGDWISNGNNTHSKTCSRDNRHVVTENCSGGSATETSKAICSDCGIAYGEFAKPEIEECFNFTLNEDNSSYTVSVFNMETFSQYENMQDLFIDYQEILSFEEIIIPSEHQGLPITAIGEAAFAYFINLNKVILPNGITKIGPYAFYYSEKLTEINIPSSVKEIGDYAFENCDIKSIVIPDGVTRIGAHTFMYCVENIIIPSSVTYIGEHAFHHTKIQELVLPEGIITIDGWAFCVTYNLQKITIPSTVKYLGKMSFYGNSDLTTIIYNGSVTDWQRITKEEDWDDCSSNYIIYCIDGEIDASGNII